MYQDTFTNGGWWHRKHTNIQNSDNPNISWSPEVQEGSSRSFAFRQNGRVLDPSAKGIFSLKLKKAAFQSWRRPCYLIMPLLIISLKILANLSPSSNLSLSFLITQSFTQPATKKFTKVSSCCYLTLDPTWPFFNPTWPYLRLPNPIWANLYVLTTCRTYLRTTITHSRTAGRTDAVLSWAACRS